MSTITPPSERLVELREGVVYLEAELKALHAAAEGRSLDEDEQTRWNDGTWLRAAMIAEGADLEAREQALANFTAGSFEPGDGNQPAPHVPNVILEKDPYDERYQADVYTRTGSFEEAALRSIDQNRFLDGDQQTEAERKVKLASTDRLHMRGMDEYMLVHGSEAYATGWAKLITERGHEIEPHERAALVRAREWGERNDPERGITLTAANGGALIPPHLDPTVILTSAGSANPFRRISREIPINVNTWNGVTSSGVTFAVSTEGGDSSDVAPTFVQKAISCFKYHGTIPVTVEAFADIDNLQSELVRQLVDGKDRAECTAFTKGPGTTDVTGIVTAVNAISTRRVLMATHSAMVVSDIVDAQNTLQPRFQPNASWLASLTYLNRARLLGSSSYSTWSATFDEPLASNILGKPAYEASDMSTALSNISNTAFVYGDFSYYHIIDRVGMALEYVPTMFSAGNALPNGRRGFYAYWRVGGDAVSTTAFVLSVNQGL